MKDNDVVRTPDGHLLYRKGLPPKEWSPITYDKEGHMIQKKQG